MTRPLLTLTDVPSGRAPLYQRIAQQMRRRIEVGTWTAGEQLKSEADLATDLRVARGTLRAALALLIESGHIEQHHGLGTFVAARGPAAPLPEHTALEPAEDAQGLPTSAELLSCTEVERGDDGYELEASFRVRRLLSSAAGPISVIEDLVPQSMTPDLPEQDLTATAFPTVLAQAYDVHVDRCEVTLGAAGADAETARVLGVEVGTALLHVTQLSFEADGTIVDITEAWVRPDRHQPTLTVGAR